MVQYLLLRTESASEIDNVGKNIRQSRSMRVAQIPITLSIMTRFFRNQYGPARVEVVSEIPSGFKGGIWTFIDEEPAF